MDGDRALKAQATKPPSHLVRQGIRARNYNLPVVISRRDFDAILGHLRGTVWLMASLMCGSGLRLMECCRLAPRTSTSRVERFGPRRQREERPSDGHPRTLGEAPGQAAARRGAPARTRPSKGLRICRAPLRPRAQVPQHGPGMGVAVGNSPLPAPRSTPRPATPAATGTRRSSSEASKRPPAWPEFSSPSTATPCATPSCGQPPPRQPPRHPIQTPRATKTRVPR